MKKIMKKTKNLLWFTFIELIISITIIIILSAIWFSSYTEHLENSRDSERKADLSWVSSALKLHRTKRFSLPTPWNNFNILNSWYISATQWKLDNTTIISTIDKTPRDPYINIPYVYSITRNKQEFQLATTLENNWKNTAYLVWDYKTVAKNIIPTIVLALTPSWDIEVKDAVWAWSANRTKFVFDNWSHNLPYTFNSPYIAYSDWTSFTWILTDSSIRWWQNSDYRSCNEITDIWKNIWTWEYQVSNWSTLSNTTCWSTLVAASCKEIKMNNASATDWNYTIQPLMWSVPINVYCDMTTDWWWYTFYPIESWLSTYRSTDNNSCKNLWMDIFIPRTKSHFSAALTKYWSTYFVTVPWITKPSDWWSYVSVAMNSITAPDRKALDWWRWWLRDTTYSEPNWDYTRDCRLAMYWYDPNNLLFNDWSCWAFTTKYICSTNDK